MTSIAITGISGYLGQELLGRLDADVRVDRIIGIDLAETPGISPKLELHRADIRDPGLAGLIEGADALVHLAFIVDPIRDEQMMRSVNVDGTRNVLDAAAAGRVGTVVYPSSANVYGAHADNEFPLTESSPRRPNPEVGYAVHKLETERLVEEFRLEHPEIPVTVLRCAMVMGANVDNFISRMFENPRIPAIKGHAPPMQVLHEKDAVDAIVTACFQRWDGDFNCAADGWMELEEVIALTGKSVVELPEAVAFSLAERAWKMGLTPAPPAELAFLMHPWVLDTSKLRAAGWTPRHTNRETLLEMVETHKPWVTLGRTRVRKTDIAKGAAATVGLIAALAAVRRTKKRP